MSFHLKLRVRRTHAFVDRVQSHPETAIRASLLRVRPTKGVRAEYLQIVPTPTFGILRSDLEAFTLDAAHTRVIDDAPIRVALGMEPVTHFISRYFAQTSRRLKALSVLGNPPLNSGCVVWRERFLVHRVGEGSRLTDGLPYFCFVHKKDGTFSAQFCRFSPAAKQGEWNIIIDGKTQSDDVLWAISGPPLVRDYRPNNPYTEPTAAEEFSDLRWLICGPFPSVTERSGRCKQVDFCMDELVRNSEKRASAIRGDIVELQSSIWEKRYTVSPEELVAALAGKSYRVARSLTELKEHKNRGERGVYWLDLDENGSQIMALHIIYRPTPYPHHFLAIRDDEPKTLYDFAIAGWSNNGGSDPATIAEDLAAAGFSQVLLLCNGGDVVHLCVPSESLGDAACYDLNGKFAVVPSSLRRERFAGLMVYTLCDSAGDDALQNFVAMPQGQDLEEDVLEIKA